MKNPYTPPAEDCASNIALTAPDGRTSLGFAVALFSLLFLIGIVVHLALGCPLSWAILEAQVGALFIASLVTLTLVAIASRYDAIGKFTCSIAGCSILIYLVSHLGFTFWTCITTERDIFYARAYGPYAYTIYLTLVTLHGSLPLAFFSQRIRRSKLTSLCLSSLLAAASGFYFLSNFSWMYIAVTRAT